MEVSKVLCVSSSYERKFYINKDFENLPSQVKDEIQIMCVLYTEDIGGILELSFLENGTLVFNVTHKRGDFSFDEIGSALKIKQIQSEHSELLEALETYYKLFFLNKKD